MGQRILFFWLIVRFRSFAFAVAVHRDIHRSLADNMGIGVPCVRSALQCATFGDAVPAGGHLGAAIDAAKSISGQRHFPHFVCASGEVLGTGLQHAAHRSLEHTTQLAAGARLGRR